MPDSTDTPADLRLRRLKWLCRRGMKELDVLLERFLADQAHALQAGQWPQLESLLAQEDDRLWDYVLQPAACPDSELHSVLVEISRGLEWTDDRSD